MPKIQKKKSKRLEFHDDVIDALTIEAAKKKTVFKLYAEKLLEDHAKKLPHYEKPKPKHLKAKDKI